MTRQVLDLSGSDWKLGRAPTGSSPGHADWGELKQIDAWLPATVPGNVRADLVRAGCIPDLFFGTQAEDGQWVDRHSWWLVRDWHLPLSPGARVHLVFRGVDYLWDSFLNGHHLGRREGMFSSLVVEVSDLLRAENRLAVRVTGSKWVPKRRSSLGLRLLNHLESQLTSVGKRHPHRRDTLKCQMGFGWDFAPALLTMGIWDDVYAIVSGDAFIRDIEVAQQLGEGEAQLAIGVDVDARAAQTALLRCTLTGEGFDATPVVVGRSIELERDGCHYSLELHVPKPHLWWPWDQGSPDLYSLTVEVWDGDRCLDSYTRTVGLRQVELGGWSLRVNDRPVYARGANWVPANVLPGLVKEGDYRELLALARQANMNMLRVWGGGLREKRAFYDLCDRLGIMVWQEFPLACAYLGQFPRSPDYLRLVERESEAIVLDLRHHPSVVLWCGGNEFSPRRNRPVVDALRRSVDKRDPERPFLAASPFGGDSHNWRVWHGFHSPAAYRDDDSLFASEFGLQAVPDRETLEKFIPAEELWPPGPSWSHHGAGVVKLLRYARPFLQDSEPTLDETIDASQQAQAHGLQIAIEHYRRAKVRGGGGVLVWQLNEPWPAISWALIDYYRQQKAAYAVVQRLMNPVLVSLEYPLRHYQAGDELSIGIWVFNDTPKHLSGCELEIVLWAGSGQAAARHTMDVVVETSSACDIGRLNWTLPPGDDWHLTCKLSREGQTLSANEYDLTVHDETGPNLRQRLRFWLRDLIVPS